MWMWKSIGTLGTFAGSSYFLADNRLLHAKTSPEKTHYITSPPGMTTRNQLKPAFDTYGAIRGERTTKPVLEEMQLRHVQVFFRHGARTPLRILSWLDQPEWPKDKILGDPSLPAITYTTTDVHGQPVPSGPYEQMYQKIIFKGGSPAGQLTKTGKEQVYEVGQRIRKEYIDNRHLVSPHFNASEVYVRSTNMMRTLESARWLLSGIYGINKGGDKIVIHTEPAEREILYPNHSFCRQLKFFNKKLFKELDASIPGLREDRAQLQKMLEYSEEANNKQKLNYVDLRDEIIARQAHGIAVPAKALAVMSSIELYAVHMLTSMVSGSAKKIRKEILRLACGPVIHLIRDNMDISLQNDGFYRLNLYACHDSTLMALLVTFGIFDDKWPPFAADLVFETYEDKQGDAWVRVKYLGKVQKLANAESEEVISMDNFKTLIGHYAVNPDKYKEECEVEADDGELEGRSPGS